MRKFTIPQLADEEEIQEQPKRTEVQTKPISDSAHFVSSVSGRNVRDVLSVSAVQYGNGGRQYDIFRDPEKRVRQDDHIDYVPTADPGQVDMRPDLTEEERKIPSYLVRDPAYADELNINSNIVRGEEHQDGEVYVSVGEIKKPEQPQAPRPIPQTPPVQEETKPTTEVVSESYEDEEVEETHLEETPTVEPKPVHAPVERRSKKYVSPPFSFLKRGTGITKDSKEAVQFQIDAINSVFQEFNLDAKVVNHTKGPTVTQYEVLVGPGVKLDSIKSLQTNIQAKAQAKTIRLEVPIPGRTTVGIEIPNMDTETVFLGDLICNNEFLNDGKPLNVALGIDLFGKPLYFDIAKGPHALVAGTTGSGKSVCLNCILNSILYKDHPDDVKLIIVDPKLLDFSFYDHIPHLAMPIINDPKVAQAALKWCCQEMDNRYALMKPYRVTDIKSFNQVADATPGLKRLPYLLIVVDEFADLSLTSGSETLESIQRIVQKGRAAGIHMILATQRPSADIVNGAIKTNTGVRIAFQVRSGTDSMIILDHQGAEKLLGAGDMLFNDSNRELRAQGAFIDRDEIIKITNFLADQSEPEYIVNIDEEVKRTVKNESTGISNEELAEVARFVVNEHNASINKITKTFNIGFNKAQLIVETLENMGIVGPNLGSRAREVNVTSSELEEILNNL